MSTNGPGATNDPTRGRHHDASPRGGEPVATGLPVAPRAVGSTSDRPWQQPRGLNTSPADSVPTTPIARRMTPPPGPAMVTPRESRSAAPEPTRPSDPWKDGRQRAARAPIDASLILAALVMMSLAVGVIVGVALL